MGLFFNNKNNIDKKVVENFGKNDDYLVAIKHNGPIKGLGKLLASTSYNVFDSNRTFIINFTSKGIYEKEISNSTKGDFSLLPANEIESLNFDIKDNKAIIDIVHLGKKLSYEIPFNGKIFSNNKINFENIRFNDWYMIID